MSLRAGPPPQGCPRPGDWACAKCGNNCFAKRMDCDKCGAARPRLKPQGGEGKKTIRVDGIQYSVDDVDDTVGKDDAVCGKRTNARQCTRFLTFNNCKMGVACTFIHIAAQHNKAPEHLKTRLMAEQRKYDKAHNTNLGEIDQATGTQAGAHGLRHADGPKRVPMIPNLKEDAVRKEAVTWGRKRAAPAADEPPREATRRSRSRSAGRRRRNRSGSHERYWADGLRGAGGDGRRRRRGDGGSRDRERRRRRSGSGGRAAVERRRDITDLPRQIQDQLHALRRNNRIDAACDLDHSVVEYLLGFPLEMQLIFMERAMGNSGRIKNFLSFCKNVHMYSDKLFKQVEEKIKAKKQKEEEERSGAGRGGDPFSTFFPKSPPDPATAAPPGAQPVHSDPFGGTPAAPAAAAGADPFAAAVEKVTTAVAAGAAAVPPAAGAKGSATVSLKITSVTFPTSLVDDEECGVPPPEPAPAGPTPPQPPAAAAAGTAAAGTGCVEVFGYGVAQYNGLIGHITGPDAAVGDGHVVVRFISPGDGLLPQLSLAAAHLRPASAAAVTAAAAAGRGRGRGRGRGIGVQVLP